jgi:hypothetical protein
MHSPQSRMERLIGWLLRAGDPYPPPGEPRPPVTLQVRQGPDESQAVVLWVARDVFESEQLAPMTLRASEDRPMWLDVDTDIMGAAVVPLSSVEVRVLDPGQRMEQADDVQ